MYKLISGCTALSCIYQSLMYLGFNCFSLWHNECQKVTLKHSFCIINHSIFLKGKDNYNKITVQNLLGIYFSPLTNSREKNCLKTMYNIDLDDLLCTHSKFCENNLPSEKNHNKKQTTITKKTQTITKHKNSSSSWQINLFRAKPLLIYNSLPALKSWCVTSALCVHVCCSLF